MDIIIAIAHILGAMIAVFAFNLVILSLSAWMLKRNQQAAIEEISVALEIPLESLDDSENAPKVASFIARKFSSDLFVNRLSDLCGWVQTGWGWLSTILQVGVFIAVVWYSYTNSTTNAIYAWLLLGIAVSFWVTSVIFGFSCRLVTGRFPGQAKQARKFLAEYSRNQSATQTDN